MAYLDSQSDLTPGHSVGTRRLGAGCSPTCDPITKQYNQVMRPNSGWDANRRPGNLPPSL